ncbi:Protein CBG26150 [Caenorhabditis briggsae]|uniref:Uncharacterized protein n=2 Tax=Caenorhabditis briggsae TaxID=6238 RepID=A0AAE9DIJ7_CAEBR|nr:Protein CBG26150 [Caenorhabditis briggsae]ULU05186.1 hypothetical protein L3Y34_017715 [Caenorhabditis briggsae]UMM17164.1 hypothetical protein L5515_013851 [Caenorhabditis briggsae]CAR99804.1 Protein CBG26150 [Caenorhabditis briggsae]
MNRFIIFSFLIFASFAFHGEASIGHQTVKEGERLELAVFKGAKAIKRNVDAGEQVFYFEGKFKGSFVDGNGKKIDSSNYEDKNGNLVIKKFTKADVGSYTEHPKKVLQSTTKDGFISVLGPVLHISLS